ncbi:hypothetical protein TRFO_04013 [Tritrichomonas foetus]|uniref:Cleavage/polyadenylation specificity factor A subunit N-terminal domain-containing protein n=1 Tax=Tritrichomonas foetus TaxID=1144522 RepID=A0A1J4KN01_9EUKA|nr:hypothetical protein TRFO_04013 [Tritrichomonas foetus]|eukprot:OHT11078.1 hypothetical protein TRFO_04013 [Tritrichomonas foetus]
MQFIHSTISNQPIIHHCVLLTIKSKKSFDILLVYEKYAEFVAVGESDSGLEFQTFQKIMIEKPLLWVEACNDFIFSFTLDNYLLISKYEYSLTRVASLDMNGLNYSIQDGFLEQFCVFLFSRSKNYLLISCVNKTDHLFIINVEDPTNPMLEQINLQPNTILLDATVSLEQHTFILWTETFFLDGTVQFNFQHLNAETLTFSKTELMPQDFVGFIPSHDTTRTITAVFKQNSIEITSKHPIPITSPVSSYSKFVHGLFLCQFDSNEILMATSDPKLTANIIGAPKFDRIWVLPGKIALMCNFEQSLFIGFNKMKRLSRSVKSSIKQVQFKSLRVVLDLKMNPYPINNVFFDNQTSEILISTSSGVCTLSNDAHIEIGRSSIKADDSSQLFAPVPDLVMQSNEHETRLILGEADVSREPTLSVLYFYSKHIQVCKNEINEIDGDNLFESDLDIKCAASNGLRLIVGFQNDHISIFHASFNDTSELYYPGLTNVAICHSYFAVSTQFKVSLFDFNLRMFAEFPFPSPPVSMIFRNDGKELFVSLHCGAIIRISENSADYICTLSKDPIFLQLKEVEHILLISATNLYVYAHARLIKTDLTNYDSICASYTDEEDSLPFELKICFVQKKRLYTIDAEELPYHYHFVLKDTNFLNPHLFRFQNDVFAFVEKIENDQTLSTYIYDYRSKEEQVRLPNQVSCYTCCQNYIFLGVGFQLVCLEKREFKNNQISSELVDDNGNHQPKLIPKYIIDLSEQPRALSSFYDSILIGFDKELKIADIGPNSIDFRHISLKVVSPIKSIVSNGYPWIVLQNDTVFTITFNKNMDQFEILASNQYVNLNHFIAIDDRTVAFVHNHQSIVFLRLPEKRTKICLNQPKYEILGNYHAFQEITALEKVGDAIIYFTDNGSVHALTVCNQDASFRVLLNSQVKIRNEILTLFALSDPNEIGIWNQMNVFDADILDILTSQSNDVRDECERCNLIMITERQKILF